MHSADRLAFVFANKASVTITNKWGGGGERHIKYLKLIDLNRSQ